ncbi:glutamate-rich protein 3-like isoform X2 [Phaenicophaeus curvirostris]|uniref:glutamate-rich protein 3-like isoform X2 n=1 Tax=Phaenicophaeus curvirostris TaxID=33595 RepID=UPI0037F09E74
MNFLNFKEELLCSSEEKFIGTYNSLTDKHLVGYFSNARIRRHLLRSGLISRSGRIIPDKEYQQNVQRKDRQRYTEECLAQAIFQKILDMERHHELEMKRKLENSVKKVRVQKIKVEKSGKSVEGASSVYTPHPPLGPRNHYRPHRFVVGEPSGQSQLTSWRPNTAPGNTLQPLRLPPVCSSAAIGSAPKASSAKQKHHTLEPDPQFASGVRLDFILEGERSELRLRNSVEYVTGISPYQLPVIKNHMIPVPPPPLQKGDNSVNAVRAVRTRMLRGRLFHPTTAANVTGQLLPKNSGGFPKPLLHSNAFVTMIFLGKGLHLRYDSTNYRDEIEVHQQHCGGQNLCVYKGKLLEGETFQFVSKRHHGFPFSLTFFLNGMQVDRLSCCCEYKHHKNTRLGGRRGHFGFLNVEGASPCYRCIFAMGLDKKPSPPKTKMENNEEKHVDSWRDEVQSEPSESSIEQKSSKDSVLVISPCYEESVETSEDKMETRHEYRNEEEKICGYESEDSQEDTGKYEYEEDFEADEEGDEEQTGEQMNGVSRSSSDDKNLDLDYGKESNLSQKATRASDSEKDESDSVSEDDKQGCKPIQEELAKVIGNDLHVNSEPEPSDSHADEEEENITNTDCGAKEADGAFLAEGTRTLDVQKAAEQVVREGHMIDEREALEKEDFVTEGGDVCTEEAGEEMARMGDFLPKEDTVAVMLVEGQLAVEESAPEDSTMAEEDPKGMGTGKGMESGVEVACGEQEVLMEGTESEAALGVQTPTGKELAGALLCREADGVVSERAEVAAEVSEGKEASEEVSEAKEAVEATEPLMEKVVDEMVSEAEEAVEVSEGKEAAEEVSEAKEAVGATEPLMEKVVDAMVSEAEEAMEEGGSAGKDIVADAVSEGEEAVEDARVAEDITRVVGPEGDEAVEEAISERDEDAEKPEVLLETLGDTNFHTGEATLRGVDFVKPNEFSQLKAAGEEQIEMGEAAIGAATSETDKASEVERNSLSAEDAVKESVDSEKGSLWQVAPGFKALVDAGGDPISEVSSPLEETTAAGEEEGLAETCSSGTPSLGSKAKKEHAMEERLVGEVMGLFAEKGRTESGGREGTISGAAGPSELVDGKEGSLDGAKERRKEKFSDEGVMDGAALPAAVLSVGRMGEARLVAFAVVGGRAGLGTLAETAAGQEMARCGRVDGGAVVQAKVVGVAWRGLSVMEAAAPEGVSAEERGTAWETGRDGEGGVANGATDSRQGANWETALGCEERRPVPADEAGWEWSTARPLSAQHEEPCGTTSLGKQPMSETSLSTPAHGGGGTGPIGRQPARGEGLCLGTQPQPAAPGTGVDEDEDGSQEGAEQAGVKAEGEQPRLCENMGEREGMDVLESTQSTEVRVQRKDSPVGERPDAPGATDVGEGSRDPCEDVANPDAVVVPSVQPQDGEETLL